MRKCIVHFGFHKTGSSALQQALFARRPTRDLASIHLGAPFLRRDVMVAFCADPSGLAPDLRDVDAGRRSAIRRALRDVIVSHSSVRLVLSAEGLARFDADDLLAPMTFLQDQGLEVEAVGHVRDYAASCVTSSDGCDWASASICSAEATKR